MEVDKNWYPGSRTYYCDAFNRLSQVYLNNTHVGDYRSNAPNCGMTVAASEATYLLPQPAALETYITKSTLSTMKKFISLAISSSLMAALPTPVQAAVYSDALGKCLVSSSSDDDKAILVRWIFASVTLNPAVAGLSAVTEEQREMISKSAGQMFERLMTVSCRKEASEAIRYEGGVAIQSAFQLLGQSASMSMMNNPAVANGVGKIAKYIDEEKFKQLGNEAK